MDSKTAATSQTVTCKNCGASLRFVPGTHSLLCEHCGSTAVINAEQRSGDDGELDYDKYLQEGNIAEEDKQQITTVTCNSCGASATMKPHVTSDSCAFCGTPLVVKTGTTKTIIKPRYVLPFLIDRNKAFTGYAKWINGLWFAPNGLKKQFSNADKLNGMYIPYWTYDSNTTTHYTGERGEDYQDVETVVSVENGKTVVKQIPVTKTNWYPVSGTVHNQFNDVLVMASKSLPEKYADALEPWDMKGLVDYNDAFLSGFQTEMYQVGLKDGFDKARVTMEAGIRVTISRDIGGDRQQIDSVKISPRDITFKHILLPIWISAYRYNNKAYRFMINGRTGEVQGERPYSWVKILMLILFIAGLVAVIANLSQ